MCGTLVLTWEEMDGWVVCVWDFSLDVMGRNEWMGGVCVGLDIVAWAYQTTGQCTLGCGKKRMDGWCVCVCVCVCVCLCRIGVNHVALIG